MSVIYETKGRAREYSELACNLYKGCEHGCTYCWAPSATYQNRENFKEAQPRKDIIKRLAKDAAKLNGKETRNILFCFTTDPYQPIEEKFKITRQAIKILKDNGLNVTILTKGGLRALRDFDLLTLDDTVAATLTFLNEKDSLKWEPKAALPKERIEMLKEAHKRGIKTWVSLEPVIDPEQTLQIIKETHEFVDLFKVGILNYMKNDINWKDFGTKAKNLLEDLGKNYYFKNDLRKYS